jgi:hypothetical protein
MCWTPPQIREKMKTNKTKNTTQYVLDITIHKTKDDDKQNKKTQHNMCWTPPHTTQKTKTNKPKKTTQYVLDDTIHKKKDEDKQNKKHNTIYAGHHHTPDEDKQNKKTQHNICWTPSYTR